MSQFFKPAGSKKTFLGTFFFPFCSPKIHKNTAAEARMCVSDHQRAPGGEVAPQEPDEGGTSGGFRPGKSGDFFCKRNQRTIFFFKRKKS